MEPATNSVNSIEDGDTTVTEGIREQLVRKKIVSGCSKQSEFEMNMDSFLHGG